jgi:hypothetical protein
MSLSLEPRQEVDEVLNLLLCCIGRKRRHRGFRIAGLHSMDYFEQLVSRQSGTDIREHWPAMLWQVSQLCAA